jgi:hypothetical protein
LSDGQFIYFFFLSCSFECIHIEENFEYHLIPPSAVYSRFLPLAVSENALFEDESMLIFFNLQVAGYKDLTLPCPALLQGRTGLPCPVDISDTYTCKERKKTIFSTNNDGHSKK